MWLSKGVPFDSYNYTLIPYIILLKKASSLAEISKKLHLAPPTNEKCSIGKTNKVLSKGTPFDNDLGG